MRLTRSVIIYKLRAASVSLGIFLVFAMLLVFLTYHLWFPDYLFWSDGGLQGLQLVCAVDFVLGPFLTLVFFHPEKSRGKLLLDVAIIACIQFSAMVWGGWQVYVQRPLAVVYGEHRFISVAPGILALQRKTTDDMTAFSPDRPPFVYRRDPVNDQERMREYILLMRHGIHLEAQAWLFQPLLSGLDHVFERQAALREFVSRHSGAQWGEWISGREQKDMAAYRFAVFEGRYENVVLIFEPPARYLGYLPLGPGPVPSIAEPPATSVDKPH